MRRFAASLKQRRGRGTMRVLWRLLSSKSGHLRGMATVENSSVVFVVKTQVSSSCVALTKTTHVPSGPRRSCERSYQQKLLKIIVGSMALGGLPLRQTPVLASTTAQLSPVNPSYRATASKPVANRNKFENYRRPTTLLPAGRWRDAEESQPDFRTIRAPQKVRVPQKPLGLWAIERAASSRNRTEPDHESAVVARRGSLVRLCPLPDCVFHWCHCRFGLAVLRRRGQKGDRWLVATPRLVGTGGRAR